MGVTDSLKNPKNLLNKTLGKDQKIELRELKCKSCGASVSVSATDKFVECDSCGTRSSVIQHVHLNEGKYEKVLKGDVKIRFENIVSILYADMEAGNYSEAYGYCNRGLEINKNSGELWENKALCAYWHSIDYLYSDKITRTNAREIVAYLDASKKHDPDSTTYTGIADSIGTNLGSVIILKFDNIMTDVWNPTTKKFDGGFSYSRLLKIKSYLDTLETAFDIQVSKDTELLKYIVVEYSNRGKVIWIKKEKGEYLNATTLSSNPVKKRDLLIKKIQQHSPTYVPPTIKVDEPFKMNKLVLFIIFVIVVIAIVLSSS